MTIQILEAAKTDLIKGCEFYERQQSGPGSYFLDSLFSEIDALLIYHGINPIRFESYYCMFASRFLFAVYYTVEDHIIFIDAVLDCRQNPEVIRKRVGE